MVHSPHTRRWSLIVAGLLCPACFLPAGCSDYPSNAGIALPMRSPDARASTDSAESPPDEQPVDPTVATTNPDEDSTPSRDAATDASSTDPGTEASDSSSSTTSAAAPSIAPPKDRTFAVEGPDGALRVGFDDLDLLKILKMDPVTPDCVERMPRWMKELAGKRVRIRGYMKPSLVATNLPQFLFVRDTGLCCFGPKGKIYDMIAVTLKSGTTTDYIELKPFDVVGTFRIEVLTLDDDGLIFGLYYIDDAVIIQ